MSLIKVGQEFGKWRYQREINRGGFGVVLEFKNVENDERLVIKRCLKELNSHTRGRWLEELKLMNNKEHKNLVQGRDVPQEIVDALRSPEKLLGLEYCDSDLRKVLSYPAHCCGLPEHMVLSILRDISGGLKFLHDHKIIHRDLKPENILLSQQEKNTVFKIADLGYAKQLDEMSIAKSFVGTLQYLAPELYNDHREYKITVDYWSFGTLLFECITGFRPFNFTDSPHHEWAKKISGKLDTDIWGSTDKPRGQIQFSSDIPEPNHMCKPLISKLIVFLQLLLQYDPQKRRSIGERDWYSLAQEIWELHLIKVFDICTCTIIPYEFNSNETIQCLKTYIQSQHGVSFDYQIFLDCNGQSVNDSDLLITYSTKQDKDTSMLFMFQRKIRGEISDLLPERVRELVGGPNELREKSLIKKCLAQASYSCTKISNEYKTLSQGNKILVRHIEEHLMKQLSDNYNELNKYTIKLDTIIEVYHLSYTFDKEEHLDKLNCTDDVLNELERHKNGVKEFSDMLRIKDTILEDISKLEKKIEGLDRNSQRTIDQDKQKRTRFEDLAKFAEKEYEGIKSSSKEDFKKEKVADIVMKSVTEKSETFKIHYDQIKDAMKCRELALNLIKKARGECQTVKESYNRMLKLQLSRQGWLWRLFEENSSLNINKESAFLTEIKKVVDTLEKETESEERLTVETLSKEFTQKIKVIDAVVNNKRIPEPFLPLRNTKWNTFDACPYPGEKEIPSNIDPHKRRQSEPANLLKLREGINTSNFGPHKIEEHPLEEQYAGKNIEHVSKMQPATKYPTTERKQLPQQMSAISAGRTPYGISAPSKPHIPLHQSPQIPIPTSHYHSRQTEISNPQTNFKIKSPPKHLVEVVLDQRQGGSPAPHRRETIAQKRQDFEKAERRLRSTIQHPSQSKPPQFYVSDTEYTQQNQAKLSPNSLSNLYTLDRYAQMGSSQYERRSPVYDNHTSHNLVTTGSNFVPHPQTNFLNNSGNNNFGHGRHIRQQSLMSSSHRTTNSPVRSQFDEYMMPMGNPQSSQYDEYMMPVANHHSMHRQHFGYQD